jgi:hypothetical protein
MAPHLSLIIPAHNEERRLPSALAQLQSFVIAHHLDIELLVVDNGSTDETSAVVQRAAQAFAELQLVRTDRAGKGLAVRLVSPARRGKRSSSVMPTSPGPSPSSSAFHRSCPRQPLSSLAPAKVWARVEKRSRRIAE